VSQDADVLVEIDDVYKHFPIKQGIIFKHEVARVHAVDGVSLQIRRGETIGIVGESGCGKSTLARCITGLHPITKGRIVFDGQDISRLSGRQLKPFRRDVQMIFQDPYGSLNPRRRVGAIIGDPFDIHGIASGADRKKRVQELMELVGLNPEHYNRFPAEFSGGQRQRIGIARALALKPKLIVCDEPVSALDVSIQAQVINLLKDLQEELGLTYVFIAHDLSVVRYVSDRVAVMYLGKIAEYAEARTCTASRVTRTPTRCCPPPRSPTPTPPSAGSASCSPATCPRRSGRRPAAGSTRAARRRRRTASSSCPS
jgi:ABC-type oligopeptide transport system ATPase subunit